jgi:hypothetical protein
MPFLIQNNILTVVQNGFRISKSTVTGSQSFIESIQMALDSISKNSISVDVFTEPLLSS